jgi:hypothetical protein
MKSIKRELWWLLKLLRMTYPAELAQCARRKGVDVQFNDKGDAESVHI